jgi:hypothetical protein
LRVSLLRPTTACAQLPPHHVSVVWCACQVTIPENGESFALIYSVEDPMQSTSVSGVGAQVMGPGDSYMLQYTKATRGFWASRNELELGCSFKPQQPARRMLQPVRHLPRLPQAHCASTQLYNVSNMHGSVSDQSHVKIRCGTTTIICAHRGTLDAPRSLLLLLLLLLCCCFLLLPSVDCTDAAVLTALLCQAEWMAGWLECGVKGVRAGRLLLSSGPLLLLRGCSGCAQGVLRVCSGCAQGVLRVCSGRAQLYRAVLV